MIPTVEQVVARRMRGMLLAGSPHATGADVVRALGAVQAQDYPGAKWALGMRARGTTDASIQAEVDAGRILRTHVLRPTWHFVTPSDIRWMLALTGPRVIQAMSSYNRKLGLDAKLFARSHAIIEKALAGGKSLTRKELRAVLEPKLGTLAGQRLAHVVMEAECSALICSGPMQGKQFTYALIDERARPMKPLERDEALRELAMRYFPTRGPATPHDFAWWSGLTVADANRAIEIAGKSLESIEADGRRYWQGAGTRDRALRPSAHLLPNYDEFFIGYKNRSAIGQRLKSSRSVMGGNALIAHVIAVNGQLVGGWKNLAQPKVTLGLKLTAPEQVLVDAELERLSVFLRGVARGP